MGATMRHLPLVLLVSLCGFSTPALAVCNCPDGCVPSGYGGGCWYNGTNNFCRPISCSGSGGPASGSSGGDGTGTGTTYVFPKEPSQADRYGYCGKPYSPAAKAEFAKQCISDLSATSQFWGCLFESSFDISEDTRTGLSCPVRKSQLAHLDKCVNLCRIYGNARTLCDDRNVVWQQTFGPLGSTVYGSGNVDLCGTLPSRLEKRVGRSPGVLRPCPPGGAC
jgi:hypothetical protein